MRARSKVYHIECFRCVACSRQLIPGDEFALREDGLFCRADHDVVERATLASGDPLSPLHPARPLQMAGKVRCAEMPREGGGVTVWEGYIDLLGVILFYFILRLDQICLLVLRFKLIKL